MSDPRSAVSFEGIGYVAFTYPHDNTIVYNPLVEGGSAQVGLAVTLETNGAVSLVGDGEQVEGKLIKVEPDGFCVVQNGGVMELPGGDGAVLTPGVAIVGDLGVGAVEGYIQNASTQHTVSRGTIIDASDPTGVWVRLNSVGSSS